eukprot:TRINITY_DN6534_c0_g2_i1.p2 TRINITY_DN6534_c0_g2~~TRINITY_DN6534_c0_g2_i1.p2  ORF type:complete len:168 (+),score=37.62 TRINITY_DN6534_c0_g2_i1:63-566(+)
MESTIRGKRPKRSIVFGDAASSLVKISVPHVSHSTPEEYKDFLNTFKEDPEIDDLLALKDKFPFKNPKWVSTTVEITKGDKSGKSMKQILGREPELDAEGSFQSIEAGKSTKPPRKYCDFTGFRAKYTDKKTRIRFYSHTLYREIGRLTNTTRDQYLELRNAVVNIK